MSLCSTQPYLTKGYKFTADLCHRARQVRGQAHTYTKTHFGANRITAVSRNSLTPSDPASLQQCVCPGLQAFDEFTSTTSDKSTEESQCCRSDSHCHIFSGLTDARKSAHGYRMIEWQWPEHETISNTRRHQHSASSQRYQPWNCHFHHSGDVYPHTVFHSTGYITAAGKSRCCICIMVKDLNFHVSGQHILCVF